MIPLFTDTRATHHCCSSPRTGNALCCFVGCDWAPFYLLPALGFIGQHPPPPAPASCVNAAPPPSVRGERLD